MNKILIIDDEKEIVSMLSEFLSQRGYAIATAPDGEEGFKKFDTENPDLVLCDIKMPRKDGFQFLKEVRASRRWVPIIIISGVSKTADVEKKFFKGVHSPREIILILLDNKRNEMIEKYSGGGATNPPSPNTGSATTAAVGSAPAWVIKKVSR
jgi:CheY-like chemotaxis protein